MTNMNDLVRWLEIRDSHQLDDFGQQDFELSLFDLKVSQLDGRDTGGGRDRGGRYYSTALVCQAQHNPDLHCSLSKSILLTFSYVYRRDSRRRSRSRDRHSSRKDRDRSRSESPPPRRKRERKTGFDVLPPGGVIPGVGAIPGMAAAAAAVPAASGFSSAPAGIMSLHAHMPDAEPEDAVA